MTIGEAYYIRLKKLLKERGMTMYRFRKESCISESTLRNIQIKHTKSPNMTLIYQTANGLNMTINEFLDDPIFNSDDIDFL